MAAVANVAARERSAVLSERNGTMLNTISNSPSLIIPVKALWHRLVDSLANRLEARRAQAELALMTPRDTATSRGRHSLTPASAAIQTWLATRQAFKAHRVLERISATADNTPL